MQLCREKEKLRTPNYNKSGNLVWTDKEFELLVLDKSFNYYRVQESEAPEFTVLWLQKIKNTDWLEQLYKEIKPFESLSFTDRTITFRDKSFGIRSGESYTAFISSDTQHNEYSAMGSAVACKPVFYSDMLTVEYSDPTSMKFICFQEPGTRSNNVLGDLGLINVKNAINLTDDLILYQL